MSCLLSELPAPFDVLLLESLSVLEIMSRCLKSCESLCGVFFFFFCHSVSRNCGWSADLPMVR